MSLPLRTSVEDIQAVCGYLATKPAGATLQEARAVIDKSRLDERKIGALKFWGFVEDEGLKLKITDLGRAFVRNSGPNRAKVLAEVVRNVEPYRAIIERAAHRGEASLAATDVAAHWHQHFREDVSSNNEVLNDQAICFFQIAAGAELGKYILGRKGAPTRFDFDQETVKTFTGLGETEHRIPKEHPPTPEDKDTFGEAAHTPPNGRESTQLGRGIFIGHGKNKGPLEQLKRILDQFKVPYKVAVEEPNLGRPIGTKVHETMESCNCAILIFTADEEFKDKDGKTVWRPSENVVYELGASGYLYGDRIVIMKEEGVNFPSNFHDLGYISFGKDQLEAKAMEILKELIGFGIVKVST